MLLVLGMVIFALWLVSLVQRAKKQGQQDAVALAVAEALRDAEMATEKKRRVPASRPAQPAQRKKLVFRDLEAEQEPTPEPRGTYVYDSKQHKVIFVPADNN